MTHTAINELVRSFLQKESLEECSVVELQQLTRNYPYASAAQLLLAEKLKAASATGTERQLEKTSLYFYGPLWQDQFTEGKGEAVISSTKKESAPVLTTTTDESPMIQALAASEAEEEGGIPTLAAVTDQATTNVLQAEEYSASGQMGETFTEETIEELNEPVAESAAVSAEEHVGETPVIIEESPAETQIDTTTVDELAAALPAEEEQAAEPTDQAATSTVQLGDISESDQISEEEQPLQQIEVPTAQVATSTVQSEEISASGQTSFGTVIADNEDQSSEPMETKETHQQEPALEIPGLTIEAIDPATAELSYTPFHTVDYFASQGIKFKEEQQPTDKFGRQLKSFTEWLKLLKKVPGTTPATPVNPQSEKKVEQMAAHSLSEGDVLTEAMAEVWEKQDNPQKAIAIYEKLSLQNPGKRAYFAAKIDHLKNL
jgi:hypothetical protein